MACNIVQGDQLSCRDSVGGIQEMYITEYANATSITAASGQVTAITMASGTKFWTFQLPPQTATLEDKGTYSKENGSNSNVQTLGFDIHKLTAARRNALRIMSQNKLLVIVKDNNGSYWMMGYNYGAYLTEHTNKTGKALADMSGHSATIEAIEKDGIYEVASGLFPGITVAA